MTKFNSHEHIRMIYKYKWTQSEEFKSVLLIHQSEKVSVTTDVSEIFNCLCDGPNCMFIEGSPGIGKTSLAEEITFRWACNDLLSSEVLVLLLDLQNPDVLKLQSIHDLAHYIFGKEKTDFYSKGAECLFDMDGKNITIILDGYSEALNMVESSFITKLLNRKIMSQCTLVVISHTKASVRLHGSANVRVEVLGVIKKNNKFILGKLMCDLNKLLKVTSCLKGKSNFHEYCCIPQIFTIMVHLAKELRYLQYKNLVCGIFNFLHQPHRITEDFTHSLSAKCIECYFKLCNYVFGALHNGKTISLPNSCFQRSGYPVVNKNVLGSVKSTEYFGIQEKGDCAYYKFLLACIQEYLAACCSAAIVLSLSNFLNYFFLQTCLITKYENSYIERLCYRYSLYKSMPLLWNKLFIALLLSDMFLRSVGLYLINCQCDSDIIDTMLHKIGIERCYSFPQHNVWNSGTDHVVYELSSVHSKRKMEYFMYLLGVFPSQEVILIGKFCKSLHNADFAKVLHMLFVNFMELEGKKLRYNYLLHYTLVCKTASPFKMHYSASKYASRIIINAALGHSITTSRAIIQSKTLREQLKLLEMFEGISKINIPFKVYNISIIKRAKEPIACHLSCINRLCLCTNQLYNTIIIWISLNEILHCLKTAMLDVQVNQVLREIAANLVNLAEQHTKLQDLCLPPNNLYSKAIKILVAIQEFSSLKLCNIKFNMMKKMSNYPAAINIRNFYGLILLDEKNLQLSAIDITTAFINLSKYLEHNIRSEWDTWTIVTKAITSNDACFNSLGLINCNLQPDCVSFIATTFNHVSTVKILSFQQCQINDRYLKLLVPIISHSTELQKLCLSHNWFQNDIQDIVKTLKKISFLRLLNLSDDYFLSEEVTVDLQASISAHGSFKELCLDLGSSLAPTINSLKWNSFFKEYNIERIQYKLEYLSDATANILEGNSVVKRMRSNNFSSLNKISSISSNSSCKPIYKNRNVIIKLLYFIGKLRGDTEICMISLLLTNLLTCSEKKRNILNSDNPYLQLNVDTFYISLQSYTTNTNCITESTPLQLKYSLLIVISNKIFVKHTVTGLNVTCHESDAQYDVFRPFGKGITPGVKRVEQQSITESLNNQQPFAPQENYHDAGNADKAIEHVEVRQQDLPQSSATTESRHQPLQIQPECYHMPSVSVNVQPRLDQSDVQKDGQSPLPSRRNVDVHVPSSNLEPGDTERDGKLSIASGIDQATPISSIPSEHKLMIGNVTAKSSGNADYNSSGAHIVKGLPKQTELLPTVGPQLDALYNTNFEHEVQSSREEVRQKAKSRTTFYQHEFDQHAYNPIKVGNANLPKNPPVNDRLPVKVPEVKAETGKAANDFKPKPLPKRSCIVCGGKQYPLVNNLISHPHMDHYFVKERKEIRPSHYLAKLVLRHQYLNRDDVNEDTTAVTAAQQSQAAVLAADSAVEKDGAVTERKHFPMNLNITGFVVFSSDLTRFTGNMKYPLPSRKATAVKLGKGGNGFVFAIFHNGKEYAVKKTVYRPNEIRVHSQLAHPNLVNLDAVIIGEEHEKHKGKFYAFCFMTKCDMDFRSVISTKEHGCLKHLKLQLSNQHDVWQLVMVNVKYVLRSVLKALDYMHKQGLVHRDVKASNILLKMQCHCTKPLMCACPQKYLVKLGDFDSSTTVPGHGLKIEPHQMIRYASVLPLGTMGYRAPEVSMHLVIAGPYEVLYTTAVDIWSFGCLLLNMLIGKCGPLKQRGEAALLLSTQDQPFAESLYSQIIKIKELQKYYGDIPEMVDLVRKCLQVEVHCRPSAKQLLQLDVLQCM